MTEESFKKIIVRNDLDYYLAYNYIDECCYWANDISDAELFDMCDAKYLKNNTFLQNEKYRCEIYVLAYVAEIKI